METVTLFALILFAVTYVVMMAFQKIRPHAAVISALIFVIVGSLNLFPGFSYSPLEALKEIDWNVIMMIVGTMGTVYLFIESKMPQLMADVLVDKTPSVKWAVLSLSLFAGFISAFVDNVATVLMIAPVALAMCKKLNISPVAPIICIAVSSNLQGAATLVGDTTSILLAKAANLDFLDFFVDEGRMGMFFVVELGALMSALVLLFMFRKENDPVNMHERTKVEDLFPTWLLLGTLICLIAVSFIPYKSGAKEGQLYKPDITNGLICVGFFVIGLIRDLIKNKDSAIVKGALKEIDYYTIILLMGLFVVIGHNWPVFFQFKGGKGIACSCAVLVLNYPLYGAIAIGLCLLVIALTRFISLGSLTMLVSFAILVLIFKPFFPYGLWAILIALLGIWRHRSNIQRLLQGKENKISFQKKG